MGDSSSQVFVFGSFTEDEVISLKSKPSKNITKLTKKNDLQFGSVDYAIVKSKRNLDHGVKQIEPADLSECPAPLKLINEEKKGKAPKTAEDKVYPFTPLHVSPLSNGVGDLEKISLSPSETKSGAPETPLSLKPDTPETEASEHQSSPVVSNTYLSKVFRESSQPSALKEDNQNTSNVSKAAATELLPRGLVNSGNLCFLNATLQALLSCTLFVQLLQGLRIRNISKVGYPILSAFLQFLTEFEMPLGSSISKKQKILNTGNPFSPSMFEPMLKKFTPDVPNSISSRPRQEDAQEFLSFVMDQMHDELLHLEGHISDLSGGSSSVVSSLEDDGWETVGPKNKTSITRTQSFVRSPLSAIFGGQLRSTVKARGSKASATIQPFLLLHLDIFPHAVHTIEDALHLFSVQETLDGYRPSSASKVGSVSASKSIKIEKPSKIMILHLMRFGYGSKGSTKLTKNVHFPLELVLGRELFTSSFAEGRKYQLVATISHHGKEPSKGHYTADTRHSDGQWLRFDDATVRVIDVNRVLHEPAYVLFYQQV